IKDITLSTQSTNKESKKTKKKNDILAQIGGDKDAVNVSLLIPLVQKAELSRSEIQILIDQLLNKQMDNPSEHSEWTEGRADPVIKLKKQLAEKEKALADEHEANIAFQNKLKELRAELNSERSRLSANVRQLEEALNVKVTETQTLHTRMQHILESHAAEKQGFTRQIEQLQAKINDNATIIHKMQEDQGQTQGHLQQELIAQRKQMEVQFAQMRENENSLKAQLAQKHESHRAHADLEHRLKNAHRHEQDLQKQVNSLQSELNAVKAEASDASALKTELNKAHSELATLKSELKEAKLDADKYTVFKRALCDREEEIRRSQMEVITKNEELAMCEDELIDVRHELTRSTENVTWLETQLNAVQKNLDEVKDKFEKSTESLKRAQSDVNTYESNMEKLEEELNVTRNELEKTRAELKVVNETANEMKMLKVEVNRLQSNEKQISETQVQLTRLQEENDTLSTQLAHLAELQKQLKQLQEENESLASQLAATTERPAAEGRENGIDDNVQKNVQLVEQTNLLAQKESLLNALKTELTHKEAELNQLNAQVDALRCDVNNQRSLAARLNNDLETQRSKNNELRMKNWKVMEALSAAELRVKSSNGKNFDEGMLNKLQSHVESEETRWESQLQQKENEIANLRIELNELMNKVNINEKLQDKVVELETRLKDAESFKEQANADLLAFRSTSKSALHEINTHDLGTLEKLQEEKARLSEELQIECNKRAAVDAELDKLRCVVVQLHQKMPQLKGEVYGDCSSSEQPILNGPPTSECSNSEVSI
ncbi:Laminin subunit alpha-2, partial [Eufriesea mexicana]